MEQLKEQLKQQIIDALSLEDITPADIENDAPLFGEGLGLDSIDALEIILILERNYGIKVEKPADAKPAFKSINTLAEFIAKNRK
ncbi:MAG: acyl carrier protein [Bacteroidales bacterium]|nr:acyl carrier protein [Bacteroidales bacterium]